MIIYWEQKKSGPIFAATLNQLSTLKFGNIGASVSFECCLFHIWLHLAALKLSKRVQEMVLTERFISYRKYTLQISQPSQYRCTQLQYRFAVISEAPSMLYGAKLPYELFFRHSVTHFLA